MGRATKHRKILQVCKKDISPEQKLFHSFAHIHSEKSGCISLVTADLEKRAALKLLQTTSPSGLGRHCSGLFTSKAYGIDDFRIFAKWEDLCHGILILGYLLNAMILGSHIFRTHRFWEDLCEFESIPDSTGQSWVLVNGDIGGISHFQTHPLLLTCLDPLLCWFCRQVWKLIFRFALVTRVTAQFLLMWSVGPLFTQNLHLRVL